MSFIREKYTIVVSSSTSVPQFELFAETKSAAKKTAQALEAQGFKVGVLQETSLVTNDVIKTTEQGWECI